MAQMMGSMSERDAYGEVSERSAFIVRTYGHLLMAILAFVGVELLLFQSGLAYRFAELALSGGQVGWLVVLGGFVVVSMLASKVAATAESSAAQYAALFGFVIAEALIFAPLLVIASLQAPELIGTAVWMTLLGFAGLTGIAFITRKDFSFLRGAIMFGGVLALILIVLGAFMGWHLGLWFSVAMVGLAGLSILYDTSNIIHHYPSNRHVAAALALFASVALMFWYVLRILMATRR